MGVHPHHLLQIANFGHFSFLLSPFLKSRNFRNRDFARFKENHGGVLQIANFGHFSNTEINEKSRNFRNRDFVRFWKNQGGRGIANREFR